MSYEDELPSDAVIRREMQVLIKNIDIESVSIKKFIKTLSANLKVNLKPKKDFIKTTLTELLDEMEESEQEQEMSSDEEEFDDSSTKKKKGGGGLQKPLKLSKPLAKFLGTKKESRPQVTKKLWDYFKEHDLQNPNDKREIFMDKTLKDIFGVDKMTMFQLGKYVSAHVEPFTPVNLKELSENSKKRKLEKKERKQTANKKRKSTQPPFHLSDDMIEVVKRRILPRTKVTKYLWEYIREHDLQNPNDKREILCDDKMKKVMGGQKKVTMFSMNKFITPHLIEKAEKEEYYRQEKELGGSDVDDSDED